MFHIQQLELVHWDYWQRFTLPLDARIITIVGPNGSGKTTLLDALRTLFALRCSGKRDYRRYVRRAQRHYAWLRARVANTPGATGRRPFFPCLTDTVTLACRIRRAGGEWTRDYCILDGDIPIEQLEHNEDWLGLRDYQSRLAWGGLTPAIAKVLALEQGDTDKLCEYAPRALLELVFDVFGDKEVLDNYAAAREEQQSAERELAALGLDLERLRAQRETRRLEVEHYREGERLRSETHALESEIIPRLEVRELLQRTAATRAELTATRAERATHHARLAALAARLTELDQERTAAQQKQTQLQQQRNADEDALTHARDHLRDLEKTLAERTALRQQLAQEHGNDALQLEQQLEAAQAHYTTLREQERTLLARLEETTAQLAAVQRRKGAATDPETTRFRAILEENNIPHQSLAEITEITDPAWQPALEALLRPYRHLLLLDHPEDRHTAWQLAEQHRYRHFIVPDRQTPSKPTKGTLAEITRFDAPIPLWLDELLNRIARVENAAATRTLPPKQEWLTRDGYHRERRGARHLGRPAEYHFGELARQTRLQQLQENIHTLDRQRRELTPQIDETLTHLEALKRQILGLQSAQLLAARAESYARAETELPAARQALETAQQTRQQTQHALDALTHTLNGISIEQERHQRERRDIERRLTELGQTHGPRRSAQARDLLRLRAHRRTMPKDWLHPQSLDQLAQRFETPAAARREHERLKTRLAQDDWPTDPALLALFEHIQHELAQRETDYQARQGYCATARRLTDDARAAYIAKLRATIRQYAKNLKALGELAQVGVDCPLPHLGEDDQTLAHAGLEVRFNFDQKGTVGLNDGEASGGQQVMKSLILLVALLMDDARPGGFVFIDEPFAHLDVANIDRVGRFLRATRAQYLITTPVTHNANVFAPAQLTLVTRKKPADAQWAPPIGILTRMKDDEP